MPSSRPLSSFYVLLNSHCWEQMAELDLLACIFDWFCMDTNNAVNKGCSRATNRCNSMCISGSCSVFLCVYFLYQSQLVRNVDRSVHLRPPRQLFASDSTWFGDKINFINSSMGKFMIDSGHPPPNYDIMSHIMYQIVIFQCPLQSFLLCYYVHGCCAWLHSPLA